MFKDYFIIDNAIDDIDHIYNTAINEKFFSLKEHPDENGSNWYGYRSISFKKNDHDLFNEIVNDALHKTVLKTIRKNENIKSSLKTDFSYKFECDGAFHILPEIGEFKNSWLHTDHSVYSAVIYLNKNPQENSGTVIKTSSGDIIIENKFNRMALYRSNQLHAPQCGFGSFDEIEGSRISLNLFFQKIIFEQSIHSTMY